MCLGAGVYRSLFYSHFEQRSEQVDGRARSNLINLPQAGVALCVGDRLVVCPGCTLPLSLHSWGRQPPKKLGCVFYVNRVICNRVKSEVLSRFWNDMLMHQLFYHSSKLRTFWSINISCIVVAKCFGGGTNVVFLDICIVFCFHISWIKWRTTTGILSLWDTSIGK